jgi:hypothetical protein
MASVAHLTVHFFTCYYESAGWSSPVARWAHNPKVGGSNPPPATNQINNLQMIFDWPFL